MKGLAVLHLGTHALESKQSISPLKLPALPCTTPVSTAILLWDFVLKSAVEITPL